MNKEIINGFYDELESNCDIQAAINEANDKNYSRALQIINQSLSSQYLQYLYIKELQNRPGTIYVPYDLPLFKGIQ